jgi:CrcB protein
MIWLFIACGGALGAVARHLLATLLTARAAGITTFPAGTFSVNVTGCFAAGFVLGLAARGQMSPEMRAFVTVGCLGGFTTFSAFSVDAVVLLQNGASTTAIAYVLATTAATLVAASAGLALGSQL